MSDPIRVLLHNAETAPSVAELLQRFPQVSAMGCDTYEDLPQAIADFRPDAVYTVRFAGTPGYPRDALFGAGGPRWIANGGAGTDHFGQWDPAKVTVTNAAGVAADMMAEYVMGCFLHFTLDVPGLQADKAARAWRARTVRPLQGQTLLIVGLGSTGRAIAARAKAFGMRVIGTRARPQEMENVDQVYPADALGEALPQADFIAVCTPLTPQTRGSIAKAEIAAMKPGVILADVSRGGVMDPEALLEGLSSGRIAAAALDVFTQEPLPPESPFWAQENVVISPHCSSVYEGWDEASFQLFLANLEGWLAGKELFNIVDPKRGY